MDTIKIQINIPEKVYTGSSYDIDIILEKPLNKSIIAGGLQEIDSNKQSINQSIKLNINPLVSGGLFKRVRSPITNNKQTWAALLAHEDGLFTIIKEVLIENDGESSN